MTPIFTNGMGWEIHPEMVDVDITPLIASGLLQVLDLTGDEEHRLYRGTIDRRR